VPTEQAAEALRRSAEVQDTAEAQLFGELSPAEFALLAEITARLLERAHKQP
jgi:hypothetical protein